MYREEYAGYYRAHADAQSPAMRDSNPSVVVIPGLGLFGFARDKREARITTEFFLNAIHVMAGANALEGDTPHAAALPQAKAAEQTTNFSSYHNYVRCRGLKRSASSIGRSKKRSCGGCRRSENSAARSHSWLVARAASAATSCESSPHAAHTSWLRI